jgi:homoaconitase/3-isopropylmalate dehydratase large subunit
MQSEIVRIFWVETKETGTNKVVGDSHGNTHGTVAALNLSLSSIERTPVL